MHRPLFLLAFLLACPLAFIGANPRSPAAAHVVPPESRVSELAKDGGAAAVRAASHNRDCAYWASRITGPDYGLTAVPVGCQCDGCECGDGCACEHIELIQLAQAGDKKTTKPKPRDDEDDPKPAPKPKPAPPKPAEPVEPPAVTLVADDDVTAELGHKAIVAVKTTAKKVTWRIPTGVDTVSLDGRRLAVWAPPGTYVFHAMVPNGDDVLDASVVLTVTGPRPPPGPGPVDPPKPPVDPPAPADPYAAALQAAYDAAPDPDKSDKLDRYALFVSIVLKPADPNATSALDTPTTTTSTALLTVLTSIRRGVGLPNGTLPGVGNAIEAELLKVLGAPDITKVPAFELTPEWRAKLRAFFERTAAAIKAVKR